MQRKTRVNNDCLSKGGSHRRNGKNSLYQRCAMAVALAGIALSPVVQASIGLKIATVAWNAQQPTQASVQLTPILGNNMIGYIVTKAWAQIQSGDLCDGLKATMTKANALGKGINAYPDSHWACSIGDITNLQAKLAGKNTVELSITVPGNHLADKFTQPSIAGSYADPLLRFDWDMNLVIDLKVTGNAPYLTVTKATAQVNNVKTDSGNFAGDIAVYWLGIGNAVSQRIDAKTIDFTKLANTQLTGQAAALQPPANYSLSGVWVQKDYVYIGYTPPLRSGEQLYSSTVQGRLTWPVSKDVKVDVCTSLTVSADNIIGPPALLNPEPAQFNQDYPRLTTTSNDAAAHWSSSIPVLSGNGKMECTYSMRAASGTQVSVSAISSKIFPDPNHNYSLVRLGFNGDANYAALPTPGNGVNFTGAWSTSNINPNVLHGVLQNKALIDHGIGQSGMGSGAVQKNPSVVGSSAITNTSAQQRAVAPAATLPAVQQQRFGGAVVSPSLVH